MSDADLIWKLILSLSVVAGLAVAIKKVFFSKVPQPFETRDFPEVMTRRECAIHHTQFEARLAVLERRFDAHLVDVKAELSELHEKINGRISELHSKLAANHAEVLRALGRLEGGSH